MIDNPRSGRFLELDALRGLAACWVALFHLLLNPAELLGPGAVGLPTMPWRINAEGLYAVQLFFMISGFVITMTVERSQSVVEFAVSRFARLYPTYWCGVAITTVVLVSWPLGTAEPTIPQVLANATMLHLYIGYPSLDPVYWSLAFELGFYLLIALALAGGVIRHVEMLGAVWVAAALVASVAAAATGFELPWRVQAITALPFAGVFVAGITYYHVWTDALTPQRVGLLAFCFIQRIAFADLKSIIMATMIFAIFALCVCGRARFLRNRILLWLGAISYPLYVGHHVIIPRLDVGLLAAGLPPWLIPPIAAVLLLTLAWIVHVAVERPGGIAIRRVAARLRAARAGANLPPTSGRRV